LPLATVLPYCCPDFPPAYNKQATSRKSDAAAYYSIITLN
jgi:hypothetical protein